MEAGAFGLSTGLEYDPGIYSSNDEILQLAKVVTPFGGRYISHIRSEDRYFWKAIDEVITIGKEAKIPVQVSHIKLAMHNIWGKLIACWLYLMRQEKMGSILLLIFIRMPFGIQRSKFYFRIETLMMKKKQNLF